MAGKLMELKKMRKYCLIYEVEIEAEDIEKAEEMADREKIKIMARLKEIKGENEFLERFYDSELASQN
jgi:hypothetical protein